MPYGRDLPGIFGGGRRQKDEEKGAFGPKRSTVRIYAREKIRRKYLLQAAARGVSQAAGTRRRLRSERRFVQQTRLNQVRSVV